MVAEIDSGSRETNAIVSIAIEEPAEATGLDSLRKRAQRFNALVREL